MIRRAAILLVALASSGSLARAAEIDPYGRGTFSIIKQAHAGRPLVVHFWSITCVPCLVEMPRLAETVRARKDFDLVLVATDPIERSERIVSRLEKFGFADGKSFAFADTFEERLRFEADRKWRGELPFTIFIGADSVTKSVSGALDPDTIEGWLAGRS